MNLAFGDIVTCKMRLKVLTPIFVGGGNDSVLNRTGYIYDSAQKKVYILDEAKFVEFLGAADLFDEYFKYVVENSGEPPRNPRATGNRRSRHANPNANLVHLADWLASKGFTGYEKLARYAVAAPDVDKGNLNDLRCFARNGLWQPYIPGTAIKGALRSVLLKEALLTAKRPDDWKRALALVTSGQNRTLGRLGREIEDRMTKLVSFDEDVENRHRSGPGQDSPLRDIFRGIAVSDSRPIDPENLYIARQLRLSIKNKNGHIKALPVYLEYLKPGTEIVFTLSLNRRLLENSPWRTVHDILDTLGRASRRFAVLMGDAHFKRLGEYRWSCEPNMSANFYLGGQTGWPTKVFWPELAPNPQECLKVTKTLLDKRFWVHRHALLDDRVSPRTLKLARYEEEYYVVGMCSLEAV